MKNSRFGKLLKIGIYSIANFEDKTVANIDDDIGKEIGVSDATIKWYKHGNIPPELSAIEKISEICVKRGLTSRRWLEAFLYSCKYHSPNTVIEKLFPIIDKSIEEVALIENLPAPKYSKFVMRDKIFNNIIDGVNSRSAVVLITSFIGMGKTTLAREIAIYISDNQPDINAIIWFSDKERKGETNLEDILNEILRMLNFTGFIPYTFENKQEEVDKLLRKYKTLLIIDNFESITDAEVGKWLVNIPYPSKAIVTSRESHKVFENNSYIVEMKGMNIEEAEQFIANRLKMLNIYENININDFHKIIETTNGNPKLLELAIGKIKYKSYTISLIEKELQRAEGDIFIDFVDKYWNGLEKNSKKILYTLSLFPYGAKEDEIFSIIKIDHKDFDNEINYLIEIGLVDKTVINLNELPIFSLNTIVDLYAKSELSKNKKIKNELTNSWIYYFEQISLNIGFCWNDIEKLKILDNQRLRKNMESCINWCYENEKYELVIKITDAIKYYYYVRGIWESQNNILRINSAKSIGDINEEFISLLYHLNISSKQDNIIEIEKFLPRIEKLKRENDFSINLLESYNHVMGLYNLTIEQYEVAIKFWEENKNNGYTTEHSKNANTRWMAICYYRMGRIDEAENLFSQLLSDSKTENFQRGFISASIYLSKIDFLRQKFEEGKIRLDKIQTEANEVGDLSYKYQILFLLGIYFKNKKQFDKAKTNILLAIDGFEKLDIHSELEKARSELIDIDLILGGNKNEKSDNE